MRKKISRGLIILGCLLLLAAAGYEAYNFPWGIYIGPVNSQVAPPKAPEEILPEVDFVPWQPEDDAPSTQAAALPGSDTLLTPAAEATDPPATDATQPGTAPAPQKPKYAVMGTIAIPILGVSENVISGTDGQLLAGVGHLPSTALPGAEGNCALAGHRNYIRMHPFRHLDKLSEGDKITITFGGESFTYVVFESFIVTPSEVWVVDAVEGRKSVVTLITCDPVVNPVNRLIVRGQLESEIS